MRISKLGGQSGKILWGKKRTHTSYSHIGNLESQGDGHLLFNSYMVEFKIWKSWVGLD